MIALSYVKNHAKSQGCILQRNNCQDVYYVYWWFLVHAKSSCMVDMQSMQSVVGSLCQGSLISVACVRRFPETRSNRRSCQQRASFVQGKKHDSHSFHLQRLVTKAAETGNPVDSGQICLGLKLLAIQEPKKIEKVKIVAQVTSSGYELRWTQTCAAWCIERSWHHPLEWVTRPYELLPMHRVSAMHRPPQSYTIHPGLQTSRQAKCIKVPFLLWSVWTFPFWIQMWKSMWSNFPRRCSDSKSSVMSKEKDWDMSFVILCIKVSILLLSLCLACFHWKICCLLSLLWTQSYAFNFGAKKEWAQEATI